MIRYHIEKDMVLETLVIPLFVAKIVIKTALVCTAKMAAVKHAVPFAEEYPRSFGIRHTGLAVSFDEFVVIVFISPLCLGEFNRRGDPFF